MRQSATMLRVMEYVPATVVAIAFAAISPAAHAGPHSHAITVGATVVAGGGCKFNAAGSSTLSFASTGTASPQASLDIPFRCSGGSTKMLALSVSSSDAAMRRYSLRLPVAGMARRDADESGKVTNTVTRGEPRGVSYP